MFIQTEPTPNPGHPQVHSRQDRARRRYVSISATRSRPELAAGAAAVRRRGRNRRVPGLRLHLRDQGRRRGVAAHQARHPRRHHGALHVRRTRDRQAGAEAMAPPKRTTTPKDEDTVNTIKELLDTRVRPAVANDGGDIVFHGFKDGVVFLHMRGACCGLPEFDRNAAPRHRKPAARTSVPMSRRCGPSRSALGG